ncbi:MAG: histone deacetylase [Actinomycetota bacterium]|nr:histone deacetylase [Actinomycetota bacterium]
MSRTVIFYDDVYKEHKTGYAHPERPERLSVSLDALKSSGVLGSIPILAPRSATTSELALVHKEDYIERVRRMSRDGGGHLDMDTAVSNRSFEAAEKAVGALLDSVDGVLADEFDAAFCMVRPPGHHALPSKGMGFCLFNNIAIATRYAIKKGLSRVMIFDWDAHHGNGTQEIFYDDGSVLYVSIHQYPFYPGTGWVDEVGTGGGLGTTLNFPFPLGTGEEHYMEAIEQVVLPSASRFAPELVMISAGYDSHKDDLLCSMKLVDTSYRRMTEALKGLASECSGGKLILTLEGGYDLNAMAHSVVQTVSALAGVEVQTGDPEAPESSYPDRATQIIEEAECLLKNNL